MNSPWTIDPTHFPFDKNAEAQIRFLLHYAILAPSAHNTQPWRCTIKDTFLLVSLETNRELTISDPTRRQAIVSLGAFVANFEIAAHAFGGKTKIEWLDGKNETKLFATVTYTKPETTSIDTETLETIITRRVNRHTYTKRAISVEILEHITAFSDPKTGITVHIVSTPPQIEKIATFIRVGTRFAFRGQKFREELAHYIIPNNSSKKYGIPGNTSELNLLQSITLPKVMKKRDIGEAQSLRDYERFCHCPHHVIITTKTDLAVSWLAAGAVYEKIALLLTRHGIAHSVSGAPIEAPMLPMKVSQLLKTPERPQMLFRIGYCETTPPHSPRYSVSDILDS